MPKSKGFTTHQSKTPVHGFTLIELLVTISIIAILSAIGLVAYSAVLKQGRDSKRQADLRSIQSALEQYNSDQGAYPTTFPAAGNSFQSPDGKKTYLNQIPGDSDLSKKYYYSPSGTSYVLCAQLDNMPSPVTTCGTTDDACGVNFNCNLQVTPPL